jgi:hypothetical protein
MATLQPRQAQRDHHAAQQPWPPAANAFDRLRVKMMRQQFVFGLYQRTAIAVAGLPQAVGQAHRHEGLLPARQRLVGIRPQAEVETQPHPWRRRGQAYRFAAVGIAARTPGQLRMQRAAEGLVDGIADHRGAVGGVVVVAVAGVFRARTFGQCIGQRDGLLRAQVQPLEAGATAAVAVLGQVLLQRQGDQVIHHLPAHEAADEVILARVEVTEVIGDGLAAAWIQHHDGVMAEAFEEHLARLHRHHADPRRLHAGRGLPVLRQRGEGQQGQEPGKQRGKRPENPGADQSSTCSSGGSTVTWKACTRRASARATRNTKRSRVSSSPVSGRWPMASVTRPPMVS